MRRADLSIAIIVFVLLTSFVPYNVSGAADIGGYLNEVLIAQPQFLEHYRTIPIASLESNLDVAFTKLMDCYNDTRKSYEDCLPLEIDYDFISSIYWNRLEDTGMQIATYITQVTDAYDLCVYDGNSETDCSTYLLDIQLAFRDQFEAQYRQEMWTYAIFIDGYGPSYDITWTDENAYRGSFVWTVAKTYGESYDNDDRDIPPETNVIAFSKEPLSVEELEKQLQDMINDYRVENGLKRLEWDDRLAEIARLHSQEQVAFRYLSHTNLEGQDPTERGEEMDYECEVEDGKYIYTGIGENILYQFLYEYYYEDGTVDDSNWYTSDEIVESMFEGWRTSPGHNENMLTEHYESAGIGIAINEHAEIVATHNFC